MTRLGALSGLPGRVTLSAGVIICHVNVSRWGNSPSRGRFHGKKLKSEHFKLCRFPSYLIAEINLVYRHFRSSRTVRRIKIKSRPNPYVTPKIRQLMKTRDTWHKRAIKTNDRLCWNAYKFFRQEVKSELRLAEKAHVQTQIIDGKGNTNGLENHQSLSKLRSHQKSVAIRSVWLINLMNILRA